MSDTPITDRNCFLGSDEFVKAEKMRELERMCAELAEEPISPGDMLDFLRRRRAALARYEAMKQNGGV